MNEKKSDEMKVKMKATDRIHHYYLILCVFSGRIHGSRQHDDMIVEKNTVWQLLTFPANENDVLSFLLKIRTQRNTFRFVKNFFSLVKVSPNETSIANMFVR